MRMPHGIDVPLTTQQLRAGRWDSLGTALLQADISGARAYEERQVRFFPKSATEESATCRCCGVAREDERHLFECVALNTVQAHFPRAPSTVALRNGARETPTRWTPTRRSSRTALLQFGRGRRR